VAAPFSTAAPATVSVHSQAGLEHPVHAVPCTPRAALPPERPARVPAMASAPEWADAPASASVPEHPDLCRLPAKHPARSALVQEAVAASNIQKPKKAP
jgi:hypothetical protein